MYHIDKEIKGSGENITLQNTAKYYFKKFEILGNSIQEGIPSIENEIPIKSLAEDGNIEIVLSDGKINETKKINVQQPFRSIGDIRDKFIKKDGIWYEEHKIGRIENYNQEVISTEYMSTTGELSSGATVDYVLEEALLIPCTTEQSQQLEYFDKEASSYDGLTEIFSSNEVSPIFEVIAYQKISEEFKSRLLSGKITRAYLKVLATETLEELIIHEDNYLKDLKIEELRYVPEEGFIGGTVAKRLTGNFNNVDNNFTIQDREIEAYIGVEMEDLTTEYIKYGTFVVQRPEDDQVTDNTSFTALDYMVKFNKPYQDRMTYPCTLKELFYDIVDQAGVKTKVRTIPNENFVIENNQFETGDTLRNVLKGIAQVAFNWARIDADDNLVMDFNIKEEADEILNPDSYFNFKKTGDYGPVNVIVLRNSQVEGENITIKDYDVLNISNTKNMCPNRWIAGQYDSETGEIGPYENRIRLEALLPVQPNTEYYVDTFNENYNLLIRTFLEDKTFSRNLSNANIFTTSGNEFFIGVTLYGLEDTTSDLIKLIQENIIKPFICLNSEEDKSFVAFEGVEEFELVISDNPFAYTQEKRTQLIETGRRLFGLTYTPMTMDMIGYIYLNATDKIETINLAGQKFSTYLLNHTINYNGVVLDSMQSEAKTKTETKYQFFSEMIQAFKHTEIIVDKSKQQIDLIAEKQEGDHKDLASLQITVNGLTSEVVKKDEFSTEINKLEQTIEGTTNKIISSGGKNVFYYSAEYWETQDATLTGISQAYNNEIKQNTSSGFGYLLNKCNMVQKQTVKNGKYTISYAYSKLKDLATGYILINKQQYNLDAPVVGTWYDNDITIDVVANEIEIELHCDTDAAFYLADLMVATGEEKQNWSQNANETVTDTVQIAKGIQVNSTRKNTYTRIDADGNRTYNSVTNDVVAEMTEDGIEGNKLKIREQAQLNGVLIQTIGDQIWISSIL